MKRKGTSPTMKDVAREARVSLGTVSKVINGVPVGESYRSRVEDAIEKLGYHINTYARGLKINRTHCIALLMPSLHHPFFALLTDEITKCLQRQGYRSTLMITNYDREVERRCFVLVREHKADGVIALTYSPDLTVDDSVPVVTIDRHLGDAPCISSDNFRGGELAGEKLLELGCKKLLFLRIGPDVPGEADKRRLGFEHACLRSGAAFETLILRDEDTEEPFYHFLRRHIHNGKLTFDGIFCNTDSLACHVLAFLDRQGIHAPADVQVIGFDGLADYATGRYYCSTIVQPISEIADTAVRVLLDGGREAEPTHICLPVRYAAGGTTRDDPGGSVPCPTL